MHESVAQRVLGQGTFANISAAMAARHAAFPHVKAEGWAPEDKPVMFTSAQVCHIP